MWTVLSMLGCGDATPQTDLGWADAAPIVDAKCATCHRPGSIAPFALTTYDEVSDIAELVELAIQDGSMPPWKAEATCNDYSNSIDLTDAERELLLTWLGAGAPEGDAPPPTPATPPQRFEPTAVFPMPASYTPVALDDYRCQLVDPGITTPQYITGFAARPEATSIVHHVIAYRVPADQRARFETFDADHAGPGWPCYGGPMPPGGNLVDIDFGSLSPTELLALLNSGEAAEALGGLGWVGSWAPGGVGAPFIEGTGIAIEPGDTLAVQVHYNTASGTLPDRTEVGFDFADTVASPAVVVPYTNPGWVVDIPFLGDPMTIPAGAEGVEHSYDFSASGPLFTRARAQLGVGASDDLVLRSVSHHMHTLGRVGQQQLSHADGTDTCLLDIQDWDFDWQTRYVFDTPVRIAPNDTIELACTFDNTPELQPVVDGTRLAPADVEWGEGTRDEMCLGILYVTAP